MRKVIRPDTYLLLILNLIDAISTHLALTAGWAREVNPFMNTVWGWHPAAFWITKFALIGIGLTALGLVNLTTSERGRILGFLNGMYLVVLGIHLHGWLLRVL